MLGVIIGDLIGSTYEYTKLFSLEKPTAEDFGAFFQPHFSPFKSEQERFYSYTNKSLNQIRLR